MYKNRTAEAWKTRGKGGVPGAEFVDTSSPKAKPAKKNKTKEPETIAKGSAVERAGLENAKDSKIDEVKEAEPLDPEAEK